MNQTSCCKQITLRGVPEDLFSEIQGEARRLKTSVSKAILRRLKSEPLDKQEGDCASLLRMAGTWDSARGEGFDKQIEDQRRIDPGLWS